MKYEIDWLIIQEEPRQLGLDAHLLDLAFPPTLPKLKTQSLLFKPNFSF